MKAPEAVAQAAATLPGGGAIYKAAKAALGTLHPGRATHRVLEGRLPCRRHPRDGGTHVCGSGGCRGRCPEC